METSLLTVLARLLPSLGLIVGGLLLVRWWTQRGRGGVAAPVRVSSRTALSRNASTAVVTTEGRRFLVGVTDHHVSVLAELDPLDDEPATASTAPTTPDGTARTAGPHHALDLTDLHPRTGLVDRLQRATARRRVDTSWRRVDDARQG